MQDTGASSKCSVINAVPCPLCRSTRKCLDWPQCQTGNDSILMYVLWFHLWHSILKKWDCIEWSVRHNISIVWKGVIFQKKFWGRGHILGFFALALNLSKVVEKCALIKCRISTQVMFNYICYVSCSTPDTYDGPPHFFVNMMAMDHVLFDKFWVHHLDHCS